MPHQDFPEGFAAFVAAISNRRPRIVAQHILEHGAITTEELEERYGYKHPPRAARDLRELGIPLETFKTKNAQGRTIAAYRFGDLSQMQNARLTGRKRLSAELKKALLAINGPLCSICGGRFSASFLQVDHRVPYEVRADSSDDLGVEGYMLVCRACNRLKSWACEHCKNWQEDKDAEVCLACYWASPDKYTHIGLQNIRRLEVVWADQEVEQFEEAAKNAEEMGLSLPDYLKFLLKNTGKNE